MTPYEEKIIEEIKKEFVEIVQTTKEIPRIFRLSKHQYKVYEQATRTGDPLVVEINGQVVPVPARRPWM